LYSLYGGACWRQCTIQGRDPELQRSYPRLDTTRHPQRYSRQNSKTGIPAYPKENAEDASQPKWHFDKNLKALYGVQNQVAIDEHSEVSVQ